MEIAELTVTCHAAPAQLEGKTDTGLFFYARARYDGVYIGVGETIHDACYGDSLVEIRGSFNTARDGYSSSSIEKLTNLTKVFIAMVE